MRKYYCQIAGLPELMFDPLNGSVEFREFLNEVTPYLQPNHLNWLNMLLMVQGHDSVLEYFTNGSVETETTLPYRLDWFDPESEQFNLLPAYLLRFSEKFWQKRSDHKILEMEMGLFNEYYQYLRQSGNGFIEKWAALELNLRNYLTAKKCEEFSISKQAQLVGSGDFVEKLVAFQTLHKEIQVEWPLSAVIDEILRNDNLLTRELALDQLKWNLIDEMNLFCYFSIEIILGYTLKLLILNRWKRVYQPEEITSYVEIVENIWTKEIEKNPLLNYNE
ncbi:MAG: DUF2764 family protein [Bacteroidales bacterium]|nr:DUF2764 family protein [Bacteroidales bacterium]